MVFADHSADRMLYEMNTSAYGTPMLGVADEKQGSVMPGEAQLLYGLVRALRPHTIIEIGTSFGYSTIHLAAGCRDNGKGRVWTVEIHPWRYEMAQLHVREAGLSDFVTHCLNDIPTNIAHPCELVFLDADHTDESVRDYLNRINPLTRSGCLCVIHDATYDDHVKRAIKDTAWDSLIMLPQTSYAGLAMVQKK